MARWSFAFLVSLTLLAAAVPGARAAEGGPVCAAPSALTRAGFQLPLLAKSLKEKTPTTILVVNSGSGAAKNRVPGKGTDTAPRSFPSYIEETLRARYPDGGINVVTRNQPRFSAEDMAAALPQLLDESKPALLIWQTGTYDAIRGADLDDFANAVRAGIDTAHGAHADVIIISPQYSPRTDFAFDVAPYNATLRWVARSAGVPFFDRYSLMRFWDEESIFDFDSLRPAPSLFNDVHRCIGRLLVNMIADGVDLRTVGSR